MPQGVGILVSLYYKNMKYDSWRGTDGFVVFFFLQIDLLLSVGYANRDYKYEGSGLDDLVLATKVCK